MKKPILNKYEGYNGEYQLTIYFPYDWNIYRMHMYIYKVCLTQKLKFSGRITTGYHNDYKTNYQDVRVWISTLETFGE